MVFVPVLVVGGVFALLVVLSTVAAKQRSCRCLLPMGSAVGILLALGEVFIGIAAWAKPATVDGAHPGDHSFRGDIPVADCHVCDGWVDVQNG